MNEYVVLEEESNGQSLIRLTCEKYSGIIYSYGRVGFEELGDSLKLSFQYDVFECPQSKEHLKDSKEFITHIGDILQELITEGVAKNSLTYTGGVDANRTKDSDESDL